MLVFPVNDSSEIPSQGLFGQWVLGLELLPNVLSFDVFMKELCMTLAMLAVIYCHNILKKSDDFL